MDLRTNSISIWSITRVKVTTEMKYINCASRSETINKIRVNLTLETVNFIESVSGKLVICYPINSMLRF
jgi:hypothetical protein